MMCFLFFQSTPLVDGLLIKGPFALQNLHQGIDHRESELLIVDPRESLSLASAAPLNPPRSEATGTENVV